MKELGLFGLSIPEEYGGLGLTMEEEVLVAYRARPDLARLPLAVRHQHRHRLAGHRASTAPMRRRATICRSWRPARLIASFALTEPEAGSDAASLRTTAARDGDHYVLNGTKRFITNAPHAGMFTLMARTESEDKGAGGISAFIVERDTPGISIGKP